MPTPLAPDAAVESCSICTYIKEHHQHPSGVSWNSHCHDCHRSWASPVEGHCTVCCRHFAGYPAFDAHFVGGLHADPATVTREDGKPKFAFRKSPYGITWRIAFYGPRSAFSGDADEEDPNDDPADAA